MEIKNVKLVFFLSVLVSIAISLVYITGKSIRSSQPLSTTEALASSTNFEQYCQNGVYYTQKGGKKISCGRAPNCGGWSYDATEQIEFRSKAECWVEDYFGGSRCNAYCAGNVPLCCYKLAITKNIEDCVWTERYYCHPSQCQGVGGGCGQNIQAWCINTDKCYDNIDQMPYIPLENRLTGQSQSQPTNTPIPNPPTNTPVPRQPTLTFTPIPNQPTNSPTNTRAPIQPTSAIQLSQNPNSGATWTPVPTWTEAPTPNTLNPPNLVIPTSISLKSPKEFAREIINPENIQKLNDTTEKPLAIAESSVTAIKSSDQKLETFIEENILFQIKIFFLKLFQSP